MLGSLRFLLSSLPVSQTENCIYQKFGWGYKKAIPMHDGEEFTGSLTATDKVIPFHKDISGLINGIDCATSSTKPTELTCGYLITLMHFKKSLFLSHGKRGKLGLSAVAFTYHFHTSTPKYLKTMRTTGTWHCTCVDAQICLEPMSCDVIYVTVFYLSR